MKVIRFLIGCYVELHAVNKKGKTKSGCGVEASYIPFSSHDKKVIVVLNALFLLNTSEHFW